MMRGILTAAFLLSVSVVAYSYVEIGIVPLTYQANENSEVTIYVTLLYGISDGNVTGVLQTVDGSAAQNEDFISRQVYLNFASNSTQGRTLCASFTILNDGAVEETENFTVVLTANSLNTTVPLYVQQAQVLILDFDYVKISFASTLYAVNESDGYVEICIDMVSGLFERTADIYLSTIDGSAISLEHFLPLNNEVIHFENGDEGSKKCINVTILDNRITEDENYFMVTINTTDRQIHVVEPNLTRIVISNNDYVNISLTANAYNTSEDVGYVTVCAEIVMGALGRPAYVYLSTVDGTTSAGNVIHIRDYALSFTKGQMQNDTTCFNITIIDDMITANMTYFTVYMTSNDTGLLLVNPTNATVWIEDTDYVRVSLVSSSYNSTTSMGYVTVCGKILDGRLERSVSIYASLMQKRGDDFISIGVYPLLFKKGGSMNDTSCFNITMNDDTITERIEQFVVYISSNVTGVRLAAPYNATVLIKDDNYVTFGFTSAMYSTNESTGYVNVCLAVHSPNGGRNSTAYLTTIDGTAINSTNYSPLWYKEVKFINVNEEGEINRTLCVRITVFDDMIMNYAKQFEVILITNNTRVYVEGLNKTTVVIEDSDYVLMSLAASLYNVSEAAGSVEVCGKVVMGTFGRSAIIYASTMNGSASGLYFTELQNYPVSIFSGKKQNDTICFNISLTDNMITEDTKYFFVNIRSNETGVQLTAPSNATVWISDNDYITIGFTSAKVFTIESTGYAMVCVEIKTGTLGRNASVYLRTVDGTATNSTNFSPLQNAEVRFMSGDRTNTSRCTNITVFDDLITEDTVDFEVIIASSDIGVHIGFPNTTSVAIGNSDFIEVSLSSSTYNTSKSVGYMTVCARIATGSLRRSVYAYLSTIRGTATDVNFVEVRDYPLVFRSGNRQNDTSCLNITLIDDMITGSTKHFTINITSNDTGARIIIPSSAVVQIADSSYVTVGFTLVNIATNESTGYATVCVEIKAGALGRNATVLLTTVDGTAVNLTNYLPLQSAELQFIYGDRTGRARCVNITVFDNTIPEDARAFKVLLTTNDPGVHTTFPNMTTITILDDDYVTVALTATMYNTSESTGYVMVCTKIKTGVLGRPVNIYLSTMTETAIGNNFIPVQNYPLSFSSGGKQNDTSCLNITVIDNVITENANYFTVYITSNDSIVYLAPPTSAFVWIEDNDYVTIAFTKNSYSTSESVGFVTVCAVILAGTLGRSASVWLSTVHGTATDRNFIQAQGYPLSFSSGKGQNDTSCSNITVIDDTITGDSLYFTIYITNNDSGIHLSTPTNVSVWIDNSDYLTVGFSSMVYTTSESIGYVEVCAKILRGALQNPASVYLYTFDGTALQGKDYYALNNFELKFRSGQRENDISCVNITIVKDLVTEGMQTFIVSLITNSTFVKFDVLRNATVIINDSNYVDIKLSSSIYNVSESNQYLEVCAIIVNGFFGVDAQVYISTSDGNANGKQDYKPITNMELWFHRNDTENDRSCTNITIIHDMFTEMTQSFYVLLITRNSNIRLIQPDIATVFIKDIDYIEVGFSESSINGNAGSWIMLCITIYSGQLNATVYLGTHINGTSTVESMFNPSSINFTLVNGGKAGSVQCQKLALIPGTTSHNKAFNITLLLLTDDINVLFRRPSIIVEISIPFELSSEVVAAIVLGTILLFFSAFILALFVYTLMCVRILKKAQVKRHNELYPGFPLKPISTGSGDLETNDDFAMGTPESSKLRKS